MKKKSIRERPITVKTQLDQRLAKVRTGGSPGLVDLFAGCGGLSLGFHRAGYGILGCVEINAEATSTHAMNFFGKLDDDDKALHTKPRDITKLPPAQFMKEVLKRNKPEGLVDIIVGGPPCQAFARIGRAKLREILKHPQGFLIDERANLYVNFLEYVEFFRPLAVLIENVPDIMNYGGQNVAEEISSSLEDMGYCCRHTILNSAHYGVPQMRQRFYLIGLLSELGIIPTFPQPTHHIELPPGYDNARQVALGSIDLFNYQHSHYVPAPELSNTLPKAVTAQEALADLPLITDHLQGQTKRGTRRFNILTPYRDDIQPSDFAREMREWSGFSAADGIWDHVTRHLPRDYEIFRQMRHGDQYPEAYQWALRIFEKKLKQLAEKTGRSISPASQEYRKLKLATVPPYDPGKFPNKWRKMEPDQPARTLTAHIGKDTYSHIHYDSNQARVISVREAARLQSFPDGFRFSGAMNSAFRQIGNAVPPLQAYVLALHIKKLIYKAADYGIQD